MIRTILGDINPEQIGHVQCHEHLYIERGPSYDISTSLLMEDEAKTIKELEDYGSAGGVSIVDAQPPFCGRMTDKLVKAANATGVQIIAVTGFHKLQFYPDKAPVFSDSLDTLTQMFIQEISEGMYSEKGVKSKAKAGLIKAAADSSAQCKTRYDILMEAVAEAALFTGSSLLLHTEFGQDPRNMFDYFFKMGIEPQKMIFCHMDRTVSNKSIHREIASSGAYLCYDSINRLKYISEKNEIALIFYMLDQGFEDSLLLSLDTTNERLRAYGADMGLDYILKTFIPLLKRNGVSEQLIKKMIEINAQEVLQLTSKQEAK